MKPVLYTIQKIASEWGITYQRVWQLYSAKPSALPPPDGHYDTHPYWTELPKRPEDRRTWKTIKVKPEE